MVNLGSKDKNKNSVKFEICKIVQSCHPEHTFVGWFQVSYVICSETKNTFKFDIAWNNAGSRLESCFGQPY